MARPGVLVGSTASTTSLADLTAVARGEADVVLDTAALEKLRRATGAASAVGSSAPADAADAGAAGAGDSDASAATFLTWQEARAAAFAAVCGAMRERSGMPPQLPEFLANVLNAGLAPQLPRPSSTAADDAAARALEAFVHGDGAAFRKDADPAAAEATRSVCARLDVALMAPKLGSAQSSALRSSCFVSVGVGGLAAFGAARLAGIADSVAAVSAAAVRAPLEWYSTDKYEVDRPHRGAIASASVIRTLLEGGDEGGSKSKGKGKGASGGAGGAAAATSAGVNTSLSTVPQYHGAARTAISAATRAFTVELNATPSASDSAVHAQPVLNAAADVLQAIAVIAGGSAARRLAAGGEAWEAGSAAPATSSVASAGRVVYSADDATSRVQADAVATDSYGALLRAVAVVSAEAAVSLSRLDRDEREMAIQAAKAAAEKAKRAAEHAAKQSQAAASTKPVKELTEAQKAKAEKARKKREAKEAKAAAKKGKTAGLSLGRGVKEWRQFLLQGAASPDATGAPAAPLKPEDELQADLQALLDPLNQSPGNAESELQALLVQLGSGGARRKPKIAKGARDFTGEQMQIRERAFKTIRRVFKRHGAVEIDTPVFEQRETLMGKYGEEGGKLIYELADQGGELLCLRYDLTVPFARFLALKNPGNIKRFHIAKVYRRDQPQASRGRFREFYQCDYDVAGTYGKMLPDAEVLKVGCEILGDLSSETGPFQIKLNHRVLLDAYLEVCGVPAQKFRTICSSIDKLDKESWEDVREEMTATKGLSGASADAIGEFVKMTGVGSEGTIALVRDLKALPSLASHTKAQAALDELLLLFSYLNAMKCLQYISFDLSLARGLDYYTGVIYEAVLTAPDVAVGSIAAGGRYDNLVGMFGSTQVPCVGISIGIERIFAIMEQRALAAAGGKLKMQPPQVFVAGLYRNTDEATATEITSARLALTAELWAKDITAETSYATKPNWKSQFDSRVVADGIPVMVIIGADELRSGEFGVKNCLTKEQVNVPRDDVPARVAELVAEIASAGAAGGAGSGGDGVAASAAGKGEEA